MILPNQVFTVRLGDITNPNNTDVLFFQVQIPLKRKDLLNDRLFRVILCTLPETFTPGVFNLSKSEENCFE